MNRIKILLGCKSNNIQSPTYWLIRVNGSLLESDFNRLETVVKKSYDQIISGDLD